MSDYFTKMRKDILQSSLMDLEVPSRLLFLLMWAMADGSGYVRAEARAISRMTNIPVNDVVRGLEELMQPDPESRTTDEEGRRLIKVEAGYLIVAYEKYRDEKPLCMSRDAIRMREKREKERLIAEKQEQEEEANRDEQKRTETNNVRTANKVRTNSNKSELSISVSVSKSNKRDVYSRIAKEDKTTLSFLNVEDHPELIELAKQISSVLGLPSRRFVRFDQSLQAMALLKSSFDDEQIDQAIKNIQGSEFARSLKAPKSFTPAVIERLLLDKPSSQRLDVEDDY